jgi:hypothetical protein
MSTQRLVCISVAFVLALYGCLVPLHSCWAAGTVQDGQLSYQRSPTDLIAQAGTVLKDVQPTPKTVETAPSQPTESPGNQEKKTAPPQPEKPKPSSETAPAKTDTPPKTTPPPEAATPPKPTPPPKTGDPQAATQATQPKKEASGTQSPKEGEKPTEKGDTFWKLLLSKDALGQIRGPITALVGFVALLISLIAILFALCCKKEGGVAQTPDLKPRYRIGGVCLVFALAALADNWFTYTLAMVVTATFVTKMAFLERIVAILLDRKEFVPILVPVTEEESLGKITSEIKAESAAATARAFHLAGAATRLPGDDTAALDVQIGKWVKFERTVLNNLRTYPSFQAGVFNEKVKLRFGTIDPFIVDALIEIGETHYLVEIRGSVNPLAIESAAEKLYYHKKIYGMFKTTKLQPVETRAVLVVPDGAEVGDYVRGVWVLKFNADGRQFRSKEAYDPLEALLSREAGPTVG